MKKHPVEDMPQFWIAIFFMLLAVAELYQSIKDIDIPLSVYLGLGMILAVASNYQQQFSFDAVLIKTALVEHDPASQLSPIEIDPLVSSTQAQDLE